MYLFFKEKPEKKFAFRMNPDYSTRVNRRNRMHKKFFTLIKQLIVIAVSTVLLIAVLAACSVNKIMFQPPEQPGTSVFPKLSAGEHEIAYVCYPGREDADIILYSHGNAEDLRTVQYRLKELSEYGYKVIGYDYEGYGESGGKPSEEAAVRDIETVYRYVTEKLGIKPENIIVYGFSVGTGPSCYLAEKYPVKALILEAPFASAFQVVLPFGGLPGDPFPNADRVSNTEVPVLVFHGTEDRIIPFRNGKKVYEHAAGRKQFVEVPGAGHNDVKQKLDTKYREILAEFLKNIMKEKEK